MFNGIVQKKITEICFGDWFIVRIVAASCQPVKAAHGLVRILQSRIFYDCNTYRYSGHTHCTSHYVRQEQIYAVVKNAIDQQTKVAVDIEQLVASIKNSPRNQSRFLQKRQKPLKAYLRSGKR